MTEIQRTISPVDGSVYAERELASPQMIEATIQRAVNAQRGWKQVPLGQRIQLLRSAVDDLIAKADVLGEELSWQMGRPIRYTPKEITGGFSERADYMLGIAESVLADIQTEPKEGFTRFIRREPVGVVLVLAPWNYPYLTVVNSIIPALAAGNTVILKHSDQTPLVAERITEACEAAGFPGGVFQHIYMTHADVARVVEDARIGFVAFTGSVAGGHAVQQAASHTFVGTGMELGGKDPAYVRADADLDYAIANIADGAFFNSGQSCCAIERVYVHQSVYDDFVDGMATVTRQHKLGNPLDPETTLGPVIRVRSADHIRDHINEATALGAQRLIHPNEFPMAHARTPYVAPQVLVNVHHGMRVMRDETFGPVVGIMPVADDAEAIRFMNDSDFGLTASIWTQDVDAALAIGDQIETGTCYMNRCDYLDPALAWVGVKNSGRGCTLSVLGYESFTRPKSFHLKTVV